MDEVGGLRSEGGGRKTEVGGQMRDERKSGPVNLEPRASTTANKKLLPFSAYLQANKK
jgi:hypothetical protein